MKVCSVPSREESWLSTGSEKEELRVRYLAAEKENYQEETGEQWDGLTTSRFGQMVDSKWLEIDYKETPMA